MDEALRLWIVAILQRRAGLLATAIQQRAKFEHWLKFELAEEAIGRGCIGLEIEPPACGADSALRSDLGFTYGGVNYLVELKTPNSNWRMPGVWDRSRPVTKNISQIIDDARKPVPPGATRLIAFTFFPIPPGDHRWLQYLERISTELGIALTEDDHVTRVAVPLAAQHEAEIAVVAFTASPPTP